LTEILINVGHETISAKSSRCTHMHAMRGVHAVGCFVGVVEIFGE
jgi:hypothetical protein